MRMKPTVHQSVTLMMTALNFSITN